MSYQFIISGYNNDSNALSLYQCEERTIKKLDSITLNEPSFVTSINNIFFTYTKQPLSMVACQVENNKIKILSTISLPFESMTHLSYSVKNNALYGASYKDGVLCKIEWKNNQFGKLSFISHKILYTETSRCHAIILNEDETKVLVVNIDTDTLYIYDVDLNLLDTIVLKKGIGQRHAIWVKNYIYVVTEYSNELVSINYDSKVIKYVSTLKSDVKSYGSTLFLSHNKIYVSNRGEETIAIFRIENGIDCIYENTLPIYGNHSRHMINKDDFLITCNKNSNNVVALNKETGEKIFDFSYPNPSGVCLIK